LRGDSFDIPLKYKEILGFYEDVERDEGSIVSEVGNDFLVEFLLRRAICGYSAA